MIMNIFDLEEGEDIFGIFFGLIFLLIYGYIVII